MSGAGHVRESRIEAAKRNGDHLRGSIHQSLNAADSGFGADDTQLLKFHGIYQQDDRDARNVRRASESAKVYQFMLRVAIPGGVLSADQYLELDRLADTCADGSLRLTTRQGIQFHGVLKGELKPIIAAINQQLLTTLSACGDVQRNVMCLPGPLDPAAQALLQDLTRRIAERLRPASRAYHEIWLDEQRVFSSADPEPFYGTHYLPRKFKTAVSVAGDSSIDIHSYDCGLLAFIEHDRVIGFNVLIGGGTGMTHGKPDTIAALAQPLGFVDPDHAVDTVQTVAAIFRDHGNRGDRRHARLKYLLADWGVERFRREFQQRCAFQLHPPRALPRGRFDDGLGRRPQHDGRVRYGLFIENGRIRDATGRPLKRTLREIVAAQRPGIILTPHQNLLLTDLSDSQVDAIEHVLRDRGIDRVEALSAARRYSMACPALPTCGLALTESERVMPEVIAELEAELADLNLRHVPLTIRMTGCPNGCARPYTADIAFVGRRPGVYHVYVGGGLGGDRLVDLLAADVARDDLLPTLRPLLSAWARERSGSEGFSDFYQRWTGHERRRTVLTGREQPRVPLTVLRAAS